MLVDDGMVVGFISGGGSPQPHIRFIKKTTNQVKQAKETEQLLQGFMGADEGLYLISLFALSSSWLQLNCFLLIAFCVR